MAEAHFDNPEWKEYITNWVAYLEPGIVKLQLHETDDEFKNYINDWLEFSSKDQELQPELSARVKDDTIETGLIGLGLDADSKFDPENKGKVLYEFIKRVGEMPVYLRQTFFGSLLKDFQGISKAPEVRKAETVSYDSNDTPIESIPGVTEEDNINDEEDETIGNNTASEFDEVEPEDAPKKRRNWFRR